ncbi:zinc finger BED domain-containing protein RICESLEEPER 2-like [Panicum virgatum]|uniref:zinc finger BED domain-containing protein RICESLEEPER 2-like n=1 Tax=Panicum virgatum TaxID=38727 RepID=UPI0019D610B3|nr:zinc finger BED domain-containing protein RICESLEEPER 2-like [Panicum virgatum]
MYYVPLEDSEKHKVEYEVHPLVVNRDPKFTNFVEVHALCTRNCGVPFIQIFFCCKSQKSEIDVYLEEDPENNIEDFDVLSWWRSKAAKIPVLSAMARDFLAIPLSTVSSESAFSLGGRILGDHRSSLTPEMLEALDCVKDWLYKTKDPKFCFDGEGSEQE